MDKMLYVAMSGAKQNMQALSINANNLANAQTTGFKADLANARSMQAFGEGLPTRVFAMTERASQNFDSGSQITTDRALDVSIQGNGWFAVQSADGTEAYTRNGQFSLSREGALQTSKGDLVIGENGPIFVPLPVSNIEIARDGSIVIQPEGAPATIQEEVARLKLVRPNTQDLEKGSDGLFRLVSGNNAQADETVSVQSGTLEGSNVNSISQMTSMISLQRQFEMQLKLMSTAEEIDESSASLLRAF